MARTRSDRRARLFGAVLGLLLPWAAVPPLGAAAQTPPIFVPGQALSAAALNQAFASTCPLAGCAYTGALTLPGLTNSGNATIGGTLGVTGATTMNGALGLVGSGTSGSQDAQVSVTGGGSQANNGDLRLTAAALHFYGFDGHEQLRAVTTRGANDYWLLTGGISAGGPTLLATSCCDTNVTANLAALGTGGFIFGNGQGPLLTLADSGSTNNASLTITPAAFGASPVISSNAGITTNVPLNYAMLFQVNGQTHLKVQNDYGTSGTIANYVEVHGAPSGSAAGIYFNGTDTPGSAYFNVQGAGSYTFANSTNGTRFSIADTYVNMPTGIRKTGYSLQAPATGATITMATNKADLVLNPAGTLATLTVNMPASPSDGLEVSVLSTQTVTALTVGGNGNSIFGAPTTISASAPFHMKFVNTVGWVRAA